MEPQHLPLLPIKHMRRKAPVRLEHLPRHRTPQAVIPLRQVPDVVAERVHDHVAVCLLEAHQHVHHLELALDDDGRVVKEAHGGVCLFEDGVRVFGDVDGGEEGVLRRGRVGEGVRYCFDSGGLVCVRVCGVV